MTLMSLHLLSQHCENWYVIISLLPYAHQTTDVLRDTVEQLERQVRVKTDALADNLRYPMSVDGMGQGQGAGSEEEEVLRRQIGRYQARCAGTDRYTFFEDAFY